MDTATALRVLIVDDHPLVFEVIARRVATALPGAEVIEAGTLAQAIELARQAGRLDFVVLDLGLPDCRGLETLTRFRSEFPSLPIAIFSATDDPKCMRAALDAGVAGYIPKTARPPVIAAALQLVAAGGKYIPPEAHATQKPHAPAAEADRGSTEAIALTGRQSEVLRLIVEGMSDREIADHLGISENTVGHHARTVYQVLGVSNRVEAKFAVARKSIQAP